MDLYWQERAERKVLAGEKTEKELLKTMQGFYKDSLSNIKKEIESFYGRYAYNNRLSLQEVNKRLNPAELASAKEEIKKYYNMVDPSKIGPKMAKDYRDELRLQSAKAYMSRLEELKIALKHEMIELGGDEKQYFSDALGNIYKDTYNKTSFDIDKYKGFTSDKFYGLNEKKLKQALNQKWLDDNYSDRIWKNKGKLLHELNTTFLQGVAQGYNPKKIASIMAKKYGTSFYNCVRLARTEGGHIMGEATMNSYKDHNIKEYQYLATLDNRTSDVCKHLDGKVFNVKDAKEGINYPEMHPNCRSTTVPYFEKDDIDKQFDEALRVAKDENNNIYYVPADTTYEQWKGMESSSPNFEKVNILENDVLIKARKNNSYDFNIKSQDDIPEDFMEGICRDAYYVNPNYENCLYGRKINGKKIPKYKYTENCQRCCPTYEMRRRGYDVTALPTASKNDPVAYSWSKIFTDKDGNYVKPTPITDGFEEVQQKIKEMGNGARVEICVSWKGGNAHVFMAENVKGNVYYIDPQDWDYYSLNKVRFDPNICRYFNYIKKNKTSILRLDNLIPSELITKCCENRK